MSRVTSDDVIKRFDEMPVKAWPKGGEQVIVNGDDWTGDLVVRVADVLAVMAWFIEHLEHDK